MDSLVVGQWWLGYCNSGDRLCCSNDRKVGGSNAAPSQSVVVYLGRTLNPHCLLRNLRRQFVPNLKKDKAAELSLVWTFLYYLIIALKLALRATVLLAYQQNISQLRLRFFLGRVDLACRPSVWHLYLGWYSCVILSSCLWRVLGSCSTTWMNCTSIGLDPLDGVVIWHPLVCSQLSAVLPCSAWLETLKSWWTLEGFVKYSELPDIGANWSFATLHVMSSWKESSEDESALTTEGRTW